MPAPLPEAGAICRQCALCCNGVLFVDVKLQAGENPAHFEKLGIRVSPAKGRCGPSILQSCPALKGNLCGIYKERPGYCRAFDCSVLKRVQGGGLSESAAVKLIRVARTKAEEVKRLLLEAGDHDESCPLSIRFKKLMRLAGKAPLSKEQAQTYAELTTAMHGLNVLLSTEFYPGEHHET
jgi:hypothetical protein